jgi:hypothetical protein
VPSDTVAIRTEVQRGFHALFSGVLGFGEEQAQAAARAAIMRGQMPTSMQRLMPFGIPLTEVGTCDNVPTPEATCILWSSQWGQQYGKDSQYKGLLDFSRTTGDNYKYVQSSNDCPAMSEPARTTSTSPQCFDDWTQNGFPGTIAKDNTVALDNGSVGDNIAYGVEQYILEQNRCEPDVACGTPGAGAQYGIIYIPLWGDPSALGPPETVTIKGFGAFKVYLADVQKGANSTVKGSFVKFSTTLPYSSSSGSSEADALLWTPRYISTSPNVTPSDAMPSPPAAPPLAPSEQSCHPLPFTLQRGKTKGYTITTTGTGSIRVNWQIAEITPPNSDIRLKLTINGGTQSYSTNSKWGDTSLQLDVPPQPAGTYTITFEHAGKAGAPVITSLATTEVRYIASSCNLTPT